MVLEGREVVDGEWAGRLTGLGNQSAEIAMMVTQTGKADLNFLVS